MATKRDKDMSSSPSKKKLKDLTTDLPESQLRATVAELLKQQLGDLQPLMRQVIREELHGLTERLGSLEKDLKSFTSKFDNMQVTVRAVKQESAETRLSVDKLQEKLIQYEDRQRRNNLRLVGLDEGEEKDDPIKFLQRNLPKWIPALEGRSIEIERAHRIYSGKEGRRDRPRTLIFKLLRYNDRQAILAGARTSSTLQHGGCSLRFFPDYSNITAQKRRDMSQARKRLIQKGIKSFLIYPALVKVFHGGKHWLFKTPMEVEDFAVSLESAGSISAMDETQQGI